MIEPRRPPRHNFFGGAGRAWSRFALLALLALAAGACGGGSSPKKPASVEDRVAAADTIRIEVASAPIVVPAPAGMVDMLTVLGRRPPGASIEGLFAPRDQVSAILTGGDPTDNVAAVRPFEGNSSDASGNVSRFGAFQSKQLARDEWKQDRDARRIFDALERWRAGQRDELVDPLASHHGDTLVVTIESHDLRCLQMLGVGHDRTGGADYDFLSTAWVLVNGRIVGLEWSRRAPFSLETAARYLDDTRRWADAVLEANP